ncbi:uroporphyrinogen-III synthase [Thalassobacillus devorans]|uniref:Uroporphyrinogen-III synthase n=1 Tax=Thalassobacillus devorans TaxID=279813 RepID=A0ABQ1P924_9BACI|nr:uroporphyrinogen-III synthase [Thalassobacillus devorans]NIK29813.1 uroporphyrinogen-III synthase [Thalassobacillus devorans]GGC93048.1 uroporphyrinogen-III synthase [Thalassobacillus devorans]
MGALAGRKILVTRAKSQSDSLSYNIRQAGGTPVEVPLLHFALRDNQENKRYVEQLHEYAWIFFTSSNGVKFFFELWGEKAPWPDNLKVGAVGEKTEKMLNNYGVRADFVPSTYTAEVMADEFLGTFHDPGPTLLVRGNLSRDVLPEALKGHVFFQSMTVYDTLLTKDHRPLTETLEHIPFDAYTFTSPSTVEAFIRLCHTHMDFKTFLSVPCVCIGPTTEKKAKQEGFLNVLMPEGHYTTEGMTELMESYFSEKG